MWQLFKKKTVSPGRLPIEGPWSVAEGHWNDTVMLVRLNTGYQEFGRLPHYEHQVGVAVPLRDPEPTGLPSPQEDAELREIEDIVVDSLQVNVESLFVAVITTSGMREFVFYTREPEKARERFEEIRGRIKGHQVQLMIQEDRAWKVYAQLS